jgi:hypothetical protein
MDHSRSELEEKRGVVHPTSKFLQPFKRRDSQFLQSDKSNPKFLNLPNHPDISGISFLKRRSDRRMSR